VAELLERLLGGACQLAARDAQLGRDRIRLGIAHVTEEEDAPLALVEPAECARQEQPILGFAHARIAGFVARLELDRLRCRAVERQGDVALGRRQLRRDLRRRRLAPEPGPQLALRLRRSGTQLEDPPRQADAAAAIAQVSPDLAGDVRDGERGKLVAAREVEAVDRVDQADAADLVQVVVLVVRPRIAARERLDQRQVELDETLAGLGVAPFVVGAQERDRLRLPSALLASRAREASFPPINRLNPAIPRFHKRDSAEAVR
jgi:hypothetical protein